MTAKTHRCIVEYCGPRESFERLRAAAAAEPYMGIVAEYVVEIPPTEEQEKLAIAAVERNQARIVARRMAKKLRRMRVTREVAI